MEWTRSGVMMLCPCRKKINQLTLSVSMAFLSHWSANNRHLLHMCTERSSAYFAYFALLKRHAWEHIAKNGLSDIFDLNLGPTVPIAKL